MCASVRLSPLTSGCVSDAVSGPSTGRSRRVRSSVRALAGPTVVSVTDGPVQAASAYHVSEHVRTRNAVADAVAVTAAIARNSGPDDDDGDPRRGRRRRRRRGGSGRDGTPIRLRAAASLSVVVFGFIFLLLVADSTDVARARARVRRTLYTTVGLTTSTFRVFLTDLKTSSSLSFRYTSHVGHDVETRRRAFVIYYLPRAGAKRTGRRSRKDDVDVDGTEVRVYVYGCARARVCV